MIQVLIGVSIFYFVVGPAILHPSYISWLRDGDPAQQYLGWPLFRQSEQQIPMGLNPKLVWRLPHPSFILTRFH